MGFAEFHRVSRDVLQLLFGCGSLFAQEIHLGYEDLDLLLDLRFNVVLEMSVEEFYRVALIPSEESLAQRAQIVVNALALKLEVAGDGVHRILVGRSAEPDQRGADSFATDECPLRPGKELA